MDQDQESSTTAIDRRAGEWVHGRSSEPLLSCSLRSVVSVIFPFFIFVLVDLGNEQSFVYYGGGGLQHKTPVGADNVDSSMSIWPGECVHNQLVSSSLAVLYFNLHFRCLALMLGE